MSGMNLRTIFITCSLLSAVQLGLFAEKLILHFDVNETLIARDSAVGMSSEEMIAARLAHQVLDRWDERVLEPISYADYVRTVLYPDLDYNAKQRHIGQFLNYLRQVDHPLRAEVEAKHQLAMERLDGRFVFPSFYKLIRKLDREGADYAVVLRTFGYDLPLVMQEVNGQLDRPFFTLQGRVRKGQVFLAHSPDQESCVDRIEAVYQLFKESSHLALQDHYDDWNGSGKLRQHSKVFPIDLEDSSVVSIFFDDNVVLAPGSPTNIVHPVHPTTGEQLEVADLVETGHIVRVDTLQAILDDNYFIDRIDRLRTHE